MEGVVMAAAGGVRKCKHSAVLASGAIMVPVAPLDSRHSST